MQTIVYVYFWAFFIFTIIFAVKYRILDPASRAISWMVWLGLATELIARYTAISFRNNFPGYSVYLYPSNDTIRNPKPMGYLVPSVLLVGIVTLLFIAISIWALYSLSRLYRLADYLILFLTPI